MSHSRAQNNFKGSYSTVNGERTYNGFAGNGNNYNNIAPPGQPPVSRATESAK